jgi:homoserine O-acetyltransferase
MISFVILNRHFNLNSGPTYQLPVKIAGLKFFSSTDPFLLESGSILSSLTIAYHTYGKLNKKRDNVIWVCHALTANSDVADWWGGLFGKDWALDPSKYFIVCANILGSCYGTTCARSIDPETGKPYSKNFPLVTIRDMVAAHELLRQYLGIEHIEICMGGSCGGHQVLEYACLPGNIIRKQVVLASAARETPYVIAIHEAQRMAIEVDPTWVEDNNNSGNDGMRAARATALVHYRSFEAYLKTQNDSDERIQDFRASSYVRYQGDKLNRRFYAECYWHLLNSLDTHHLGRGRVSIEETLGTIDIPTLIISIQSDQLIPPSEQQFLNRHIQKSDLVTIPSSFGHDGFLTETQKINQAIIQWLNSK